MTDAEDVQPARLVSYAQNHEDILLYRALRHVEHGRYVDLGAAWPTQDSVTRLFYDRGWSGVNVEPNPEFLTALLRERERDVNLGVAVGATSGTGSFALIRDTGLSTLDSDLAEQHLTDGREITWIDVPIQTLAAIVDEHLPDQPIHFLKIDVEGAEAEVITGNDWSRYRPWIVVAEVGNPSNQTDDDPRWEPDLLAQSYVRVFDDGVNRYYLAEEHIELRMAFAVPPNALDGFVAASVVELENSLNALHTADANARDLAWQLEKQQERSEWFAHEAAVELAAVRWRHDNEMRSANQAAREQDRALRLALAQARAEATAQGAILADAIWRAKDLAHQKDELHAQIASMLTSRSWQVTRPLRIAYSLKAAPMPGLRFIVYRLFGGRFGTSRLIRPAPSTGKVRSLARRLIGQPAADVVTKLDVATSDGLDATLDATVWPVMSGFEADCVAVLQSIEAERPKDRS